MCYYALTIFLGCGHALHGCKPVHSLNSCPVHDKEAPNRRSLRTPSLTDSISTRPSPRTTISSLEYYQQDAESEGKASEPETACASKLSHPFYTHRVYGLCETCWQRSERRLAQLDNAVVAEMHGTFIAKAKQDKVIFEGRRPRQLQLVAMRDAQKTAEAEKTAPSAPPLIKDNASTMNYVRGLWNPARTALNSPRRSANIAEDCSMESAAPATTTTSYLDVFHGRKIANPEIEPG